MKGLIPLFVSALFVAVYAAGVGWWLQVYEERPLIAIRAVAGEDYGLPVYAQFSVMQSLVIHEPAEITRLVVPMRLVNTRVPFEVRLLNNGDLIARWNLVEAIKHSELVQEISFDLAKPREMSGNIEVVFDGSPIDLGAKDQAPRVFIETEDRAYRDGNYRIASNEKKGDVGLSLYQRERRGIRLLNEWRERPLSGVGWIGVVLLGAFLVGLLPWSLRHV